MDARMDAGMRAPMDLLGISFFQQQGLLDRAPLTGVVQPFDCHGSTLGGHNDGESKVGICRHSGARLQLKNRFAVDCYPHLSDDIAKNSKSGIINAKPGFHGVPNNPAGLNRVARANAAHKSQS